MKGPFRRANAPMLAIAALAVVGVVAGGAYAATSGSGTITVCVHHRGGSLYKASTCRHKDKRLSWNTVGPQGPAGPKGNTGAQGNPGTNGTNGAVAGYSTNNETTITTLSATATTLATKNLPAGNFLVNAKVSLRGNATAAGAAIYDRCSLTDGSTIDNAFWASPIGTFAANYAAYGTVAMEIAVSSTSPSTVSLSCYIADMNGTGVTGASDFTAISAVQTSNNS